MGGDLHAHSRKGQGSTFHFRLPFKMPPENSEQRLLTPPGLDLRGLSILLVDDNAMALKVIQETLESLQFKVTACTSGQQALQLVKQDQSFDIALLDWRMPDLDGEQTARALREIAPDNMPLIILMTAYGKEALEHVEQMPIDGFLIKPITPSSLFDTLAQAQSQSRQQSITNARHPISRRGQDRLTGKVILAEDNHINQQVAAEILSNMGLQVIVCANGIEVMQSLKTEQPDLILMDIQMPEMDGYETTKRILASPRHRHIPIIAMTANAMTDDIKQTRDAGMQEHISKPVDPGLLYATLARYLEPAQAVPVDEHAESVNPWPDRIEGLNIRQGIKQVGGNEALYQKLVSEFMLDNEGLANDFPTLFENDPKAFERKVHTLKGVSANIGADRLHKACNRIHRRLKSSSSIPDELFDDFRNACQNLCRGIRDLVENESE